MLRQGNGEARPWPEVLPYPHRSDNKLQCSEERRRRARDNARFVQALCVRYGVSGQQRRTWIRYTEWCDELGLPIDDDASVSAWLADQLTQGVSATGRALGCKAVTVEKYAKNLQSAFGRLKMRTRPMRALTQANDTVLGAGKTEGRIPEDEFEVPTWAELMLVARAATRATWVGFALPWDDFGLALRAFGTAGCHLTDGLALRICDILQPAGLSGEVQLRFPSYKTDLVRIGYVNSLGQGEDSHLDGDMVAAMVRLRDRRRSEVGPGQDGQRLWPVTSGQFMRQLKALEGGITTARAFRRGLIHNALQLGGLRPEIKVTTHHESEATVGRYTSELPMAERDAQVRLAHRAKRQKVAGN